MFEGFERRNGVATLWFRGETTSSDIEPDEDHMCATAPIYCSSIPKSLKPRKK